MVQVVAAILEHEGKVLIGQRQPEQSHALKWEFPGGKVEAGETPEQAVARELEEELGIRSAAGPEITRYEYQYPGKDPILLVFFRIVSHIGEPRNLVFHDMRWVPIGELASFDFVEGDRDFIRTFGSGNRAGSH
ncbi:MAG TPA: (deoxy)nucleoside triphosphate pyrophosphohydrolase [Bryobacteraceae bacterium]|nr:(deoxy)nucleoside triphosphate pyrophosphohydrolase [Bryobacteraceae bacterium]